MKRPRFTEEQITLILREREAGAKTAEVCRKHGISDATFHKWKARYGGLEVSDARRLKQDMGALEIAEAIKRDHTLATALGIQGTPTFVIGDRLLRGAASTSAIRARIRQARKQ